MDEEFTTSTIGDVDQIQKLQQRIKQLWIAFAILGGACILCFILVGIRMGEQSKALSRMTDDVIFGRFVHYEAESDDYVKPIVNAIQFFHDGYSMQFDKVEYTPQGLLLSGEIGNPNTYRVSNLDLNFAARPDAAKVRDKWDKGDKNFAVWPPEWDIGSARTHIGDLEPGHTARFNVTIPNVKEKSDQIRIAVLFSGERYVYSNGR
jgi:hypothetical protein